MATESEKEAVNAEQQVRGKVEESVDGRGRRRFLPIFIDMMGQPLLAEGGLAPPPDRIMLVNPLTQGMVVLQMDPQLMADLFGKGGGWGGSGSPPSALRASIKAMKTVEVGQEGKGPGECPVCLDELAGEAAVVKKMSCRHTFHGHCIEKWLGMHGSCPVCRYRMPAEEEWGSKKGDGGGVEGEADEDSDFIFLENNKSIKCRCF